MKVLQINTVSGFGSTGRTCSELGNALRKCGHESFIAYGQNTSILNGHSFKIGTKLENHFHNAYSRVFGKQGYQTKSGTNKLIQYIESINPDVIHLDNLHGNYLNLEILFNYLAHADKPVVWTLHDCWAFTGKCAHYTDIGCYKWQTHCNHCPQVSKYPPSIFFDRSKEMFDDKKKWFTSIKNLTIITVSDWLAGEVSKSFLAKFPIVRVYNWIDHSIFKLTESNIRKKLGINDDKFVILGVSAHWTSEKNRLDDFIKLSRIITPEMQIVLLGDKKKLKSLPNNIIHIPYLHNTTELAEMYTMADVYVHMSVEDTFGKVIAEAMSCGTPAIVYNATACPELIGENCGYVVEKRNIDSIYRNICLIKANGKQFYSEACRKHVIENFDLKTNTSRIIDLYKSALAL